MKPATRWFDESFAPMPCCDERFARQQQAPASTTVSHGFAVAGYSSPPFGSNYQYLDSKPYPLDRGPASAADLDTQSWQTTETRHLRIIAFTKHELVSHGTVKTISLSSPGYT